MSVNHRSAANTLRSGVTKTWTSTLGCLWLGDDGSRGALSAVFSVES